MTTEDLHGQVARSAAVERELREEIGKLRAELEQAKHARELAEVRLGRLAKRDATVGLYRAAEGRADAATARATAAESALAEARGALKRARDRFAPRHYPEDAEAVADIDAALARAGEQGVLVVCDHAPNEPHQKDGAMPGRVSRHLCLHPRAGEQAPLPEKQLSGSAGPGCGACAEESKEGMPSGSLHGAGEQGAPQPPPEVMAAVEEMQRHPPLSVGCGNAATWRAGEPASSGQEVAHGGVLDRGKSGAGAGGSAGGVADGLSQGRAPKEVAPPPGEQGKGGGEGLREAHALLVELRHELLRVDGRPSASLAELPASLRRASTVARASAAIRAIEDAEYALALLAPAQPAEHHGDAIARARKEGATEMRERCALALEHPALSGDLPFTEAADVVREVPLPEEQPAPMVTCSTDTEEHHGPHRLRHPTRDEKSWCLDPVPAEHPASSVIQPAVGPAQDGAGADLPRSGIPQSQEEPAGREGVREALEQLADAIADAADDTAKDRDDLREVLREAAASIHAALSTPPATDTAPRSGIPPIDHDFQANTWPKRDECDKRVSDDGRNSRQCGRPRREHQNHEGGK